LLGYTSVSYPEGWVIALNRSELSPRWGAWRPVLLAGAVAGVVAYLFVTWLVLATLYCGPVWLLGFFANRDLTLRASWKLAGASLMPGALAMLLVIFSYGIGMLDLVQLGFALAAHVLLGWVYLGLSPFFVRRSSDTEAGSNPFTPEPE
jgi:hypothetical protein